MKKLIFPVILIMSTHTLASQCKVKYELIIKKNENHYQDYAHCGFNPELSEYTRRDSLKLEGLSSFSECKDEALRLIGERVEYNSLVMVVPHSMEGMYATCIGTISKIRSVKFRR